ncbi:MAG: hypothetical protein A2W31_14760 [Planctomycetes bacterium RBG_16_64_10]|nr:MAG: hypothetical protein A2W31_14760 [Planctomycetes bacterium RBG_16_64_10]
MPTLVTGATGLLGNNLVRLLLAQGQPVRVLVRAGSDPRPLDGLPVEVARGDIRDADAVRSACRGAQLVIHSAAQVWIGWTGLLLHQAVNVTGARHVAEAAHAAHARLVHVSTVDTLGLGSREAPADEETPHRRRVLCPYVVTKQAAEQEVLRRVDQGLDAVIVNPGCLLGPYDWKPSSGRMLLEVARGRARFAPRGANEFCDVRAVAAGVLAAAHVGQTGRRYLLGGQSMTYLEAWTLFAHITGVRPPMAQVGPVVLTIAGLLGDLRTRLTGREGYINSASVAMARLPKYFTSRRAELELGYQTGSVASAAEAAWDWFRAHGYAAARGQPAGAAATAGPDRLGRTV